MASASGPYPSTYSGETDVRQCWRRRSRCRAPAVRTGLSRGSASAMADTPEGLSTANSVAGSDPAASRPTRRRPITLRHLIASRREIGRGKCQQAERGCAHQTAIPLFAARGRMGSVSRPFPREWNPPWQSSPRDVTDVSRPVQLPIDHRRRARGSPRPRTRASPHQSTRCVPFRQASTSHWLNVT
jgi:hypothetical protein